MHISVLQKEVLEYLDPKPDENFIDCTIGEGGHALVILERNKPKGKVLGIDWDQKQIENCKLSRLYRGFSMKSEKIENFKNRVILICDDYINLKEIVGKNKFEKVSGILFDLGMSSWHLEESGRGFSFMRDEPLDMRYNIKSQIPNPKSQITAEKIVNEYPQDEIEKILKEYGEEKFSRRIAGEIIKERKIKPIKTTFQLIEAIKKAIPARFQRQRINFATRTFQALRIAVNDELNNLKEVLPQSIEVLERGGRIVIISFHSLEDRIVKNFFREEAKKGLIKILTKKPARPKKEEININPRSRSAKLRACQKF